MAQQPVARKQSRLKRDDPQDAEPDSGRNGRDQEMASYEDELADYLVERIKPGLNRGAIPLLARSIAREVAQWEISDDGGADDDGEPEPQDQVDDEPEAEAEAAEDDEAEAEDDANAEAPANGESDFEADMHDLQSELGDDWIVRFSVHRGEAWLTAETDDGTQRLEAPNASVLLKAAKLLSERGGRSG